MTAELAFANARIVLDDEVVHGSVLVRDGRIADVSSGPSAVGEDLDGDLLMPGLVELHTDHLEGHMMPRPGTHWDPIPAVLAHDAQFGGAGATTVFDAVRVGFLGEGDAAAESAQAMAHAIQHAVDAGLTRAEHFLHIRCEVAATNTIEQFEQLADLPIVRLASLMDHTPGARQYADVEAFRRYMVGKHRVSDAGFDALVAERKAIAAEHAGPNRLGIVERAALRGLALAAHDDATLEHVEEAVGFGVRISEFPTTLEAARAAHGHGQFVVMGAPNVVRGGSQSGNVAAVDVHAAGLLDVLSSDYVPSSPLQAVFLLLGRGAITLPEGVRLVSGNPAAAVGLEDRGRIAPGLRADLVRVRAYEGAPSEQHPSGAPVPVVRGVWRTGGRVA